MPFFERDGLGELLLHVRAALQQPLSAGLQAYNHAVADGIGDRRLDRRRFVLAEVEHASALGPALAAGVDLDRHLAHADRHGDGPGDVAAKLVGNPLQRAGDAIAERGCRLLAAAAVARRAEDAELAGTEAERGRALLRLLERPADQPAEDAAGDGPERPAQSVQDPARPMVSDWPTASPTAPPSAERRAESAR